MMMLPKKNVVVLGVAICDCDAIAVAPATLAVLPPRLESLALRLPLLVPTA